MKVRHRIPTIFNLSMVDVLCCALGCVILLWLLNLREARDRAVAVGETADRLRESESQLQQTNSLLQNVRTERDEVSRRAEAAARERDKLRRELQEAGTQLAGVEEALAKAKTRNDALSRQQRSLTKEKTNATQRIADLEELLRDQEALAKSSARRLNELDDQLQDAQATNKSLLADVRAYRTKLSAADMQAKTLEAQATGEKKDLAEANRTIGTLQEEQKALREQLQRTQAAVENRFEGIRLTGKRVIFLVDMSGSMELVDERTPDANKWVGVRETLAKIMRSLPELEKFQVIVFSDNFSYLLGNQGTWLDFDPKTSLDRAVQALAAIKPNGATNMYDAFETVFRFRALGLDTVYFLSDGLPNVGAGLTPEQASTLKEMERSEILAKYIRGLLRSNWNRPIPGQPRVRINTVGFFYESPDVGAFLWALARENDGSFVGMSKP
jgi:uncharacterized coiled-coil DUF342 family protein